MKVEKGSLGGDGEIGSIETGKGVTETKIGGRIAKFENGKVKKRAYSIPYMREIYEGKILGLFIFVEVDVIMSRGLELNFSPPTVYHPPEFPDEEISGERHAD